MTWDGRAAAVQDLSSVARGCIGLSVEHLALRDSVDALARRHVRGEVVRAAVDAESAVLPPFWCELADQGLLGLHVAEEAGGAGYGLLETAVVLEELGRHLAPGPYLPTVLTSAVLQAAGQREHLPGLCDGTLVGATALDAGSLRGTRHADGSITLGGSTAPALGAPLADLVVVPANVDGEPVWMVLTGAEVHTEDIGSLDLTRRLSTVRVEHTVPSGRVLDVAASLPRDLAVTLLAAEATGMAEWTTRTAAEHAAVREQFGRPIGQFQGVKHRCARMLAATERARACAWDAAVAFDQARAGQVTADEVSLTAAVAGSLSLQASFVNAKDCIQVLGGTGFTWEHDAGLYLRRAHSVRILAGSAARWHQRVAELTLRGVRRELGVDLPPEADRVRESVRAELGEAAALPASERVRFLAEHGFTAPHLPTPWGKGADPVCQLVIAEELRTSGLRPHDMVIGNWVVPTLIAHGQEHQLEQFLPPSLRGEIVWCQLFSEPGAGSDLASLTTRAAKVDGGWRVHGRKVWTSRAREADFGILLARTDATVAKHRGLSYFLVDMRSPGIDVRPLRDLNGGHAFNEVLLEDVFVPDDMLVGNPGEGWKIARTTLADERVSLSHSSALGSAGEALVELATEDPAGEESHRRTVLGRVLAEAQSGGLLGLRNVLRAVAGAPEAHRPGAESSVAKLLGGEHTQEVWELLTEWQGPEAVYGEPEQYGPTWWFLNSRNLSIAGGTTEIQLNIIAERLLGLPRDPAPGE